MINVGLLGARGYVGAELLQLLNSIPDYRVAFVGSRQLAGQPVFPDSETNCDLKFSDLEPQTIANAQDVNCWIIAQANGVAAEFVKVIEAAQSNRLPSQRIIDVSSDHRFDPNWIYGLPEKNESNIRNALRIANPGCYATAAQLAALPLLDRIKGSPTFFGVSGYSGAGRTPNDRNDPKRLANNLLPYSLANHLHQREVSRHLGLNVQLMPHVAAYFRGISLTATFQLKTLESPDSLRELYSHYYASSNLVDVTNEIPEVQQVAETNLARIGGFSIVEQDPERVVLVSTLDNLRKGAATQAIQNMNLMFNLPANHGLQ